MRRYFLLNVLGLLSLNGCGGSESDSQNSSQLEPGLSHESSYEFSIKKNFNGSGDDVLRKMITSSSDSLLMLASTNSPEFVPSSVDSDDWVVKLDSKLNVVWQYNKLAEGDHYYSNIYESTDGSVYLLGQNKINLKATVAKLDSDGSFIWETEFTPTYSPYSYTFSSIAEFNGTLFVSANEQDSDSCVDCTHSNGISFLHTLDIASGSLSTGTLITSSASIDIQSADHLIASTSGELLIAGTANSNSDSSNIGLYILAVNSGLNERFTWDSISLNEMYSHLNAATPIELSNGNYVIHGQMERSSDSIVSFIARDGSHLELLHKTSSGHHNRLNPLVESETGIVYVLFSDAKMDGQLWAIDSNNFNESLDEISFNTSYTSKFIISENTYYFGGHNVSNGNWDIVIVRE
ncbi:hypothetical protein [Enterovibrio norvegicus]|uniref:Uncharacterized protein n=1 Tax=Enterovibrio norvegicus TaxID=188144 RepID=A0A2N7LC20_9GAMM|nr:hypothetical protein [Enterovibrio norvegicus]PML78165.1 hypothetical protein BCT69_16710 [Enterovibrio norvegicus]PMN69291.1 hypothetical protein BCT27_21435 [Enterovibrio norvegicus]PMN92883.1 hypothetical protein BCT23_02700 [Enterovibrio norvegicus]